MTNVWTTLSVVALLTAGPAFAALPFDQADANGDGGVSMSEAKVAMPDLTAAQFAAADADANGVLSKDEYAAIGG